MKMKTYLLKGNGDGGEYFPGGLNRSSRNFWTNLFGRGLAPSVAKPVSCRPTRLTRNPPDQTRPYHVLFFLNIAIVIVRGHGRLHRHPTAYLLRHRRSFVLQICALSTSGLWWFRSDERTSAEGNRFPNRHRLGEGDVPANQRGCHTLGTGEERWQRACHDREDLERRISTRATGFSNPPNPIAASSLSKQRTRVAGWDRQVTGTGFFLFILGSYHDWPQRSCHSVQPTFETGDPPTRNFRGAIEFVSEKERQG